MRQLEADPEWVAKRDTRETRNADRASRIQVDEKPILDDLAAIGITVSSVYDFVGKQAAPVASFPVLLRHLNIGHQQVVREGIIRALGLPSARGVAFEPLCIEYSKETDSNLRWVIANALSGMASFNELAHLPGIAEFSGLFDP
jgi:hypothetical protein